MLEMKVTVSVIIITYKHESYIKETLEGILMQECDCNVEVIIADDKSPDKTETIVLDLINNHVNGHWIKYTKHSHNKGMMPNFIWALKKCSGKYIALCEGDDYWIDPLKLQKQVDVLEANRDYGVVHTDANVYFQNTNRLIENVNKLNKVNQVQLDNPAEELILGNYRIYTLTALFRSDLIDKVNFEAFKKFKMGDLPLWLTLTQFTKFYYINEPTAVYRKAEGSASNPSSKRARLDFKISSKEVRLYFANSLNLNASTINKVSDQYHKAVLRKKFEDKESGMSSKTFFSIHKKSLKDLVLFLGCKSKIVNTIVKTVAPNMS
jgi:glycosyltransferase involved in cell wall biosynthesis